MKKSTKDRKSCEKELEYRLECHTLLRDMIHLRWKYRDTPAGFRTEEAYEKALRDWEEEDKRLREKGIYTLKSVRPGHMQYFAGREKELAYIRSCLEEGRGPVFLYGMGGVGKTTVAAAYAERYVQEYENVLFLYYDGSIRSLMADDNRVQRQHTLVVLDNCNLSDRERDREMQSFLELPGHILVAGRKRNEALFPVSLEIRPFQEKEELEQLLECHAPGRLTGTQREELWDYAEKIHYLTLPLVMKMRSLGAGENGIGWKKDLLEFKKGLLAAFHLKKQGRAGKRPGSACHYGGNAGWAGAVYHGRTCGDDRSQRAGRRPVHEKLLDFTVKQNNRAVWGFLLPLMLSGGFQYMYAVVNAAILGRTVNMEAVAVIGACSGFNGLISNLFGGMASGAGFYFSRCVGSGQRERVDRAFGGALYIILAVYAPVVFAALFPQMVLPAANVQEELSRESCAYLRLIFLGAFPVGVKGLLGAFPGLRRSADPVDGGRRDVRAACGCRGSAASDHQSGISADGSAVCLPLCASVHGTVPDPAGTGLPDVSDLPVLLFSGRPCGGADARDLYPF